jgi:hypothetical protein
MRLSGQPDPTLYVLIAHRALVVASTGAQMRRLFAIVTALICAFFVFYTIRLLVVTRFLTQLRAGGGGAYAGAVVFPLLAIGLGFLSKRLWMTTPDGARRGSAT